MLSNLNKASNYLEGKLTFKFEKKKEEDKTTTNQITKQDKSNISYLHLFKL